MAEIQSLDTTYNLQITDVPCTLTDDEKKYIEDTIRLFLEHQGIPYKSLSLTQQG